MKPVKPLKAAKKGRPPGRTCTARFNLFLPPGELAAVKRAAGKMGMSSSALVRLVLRIAIKEACL